MAITQLSPAGLPGRRYGTFGISQVIFNEAGTGDLVLSGSGLDEALVFMGAINVVSHHNISIKSGSDHITVRSR